MSRPVVIVVRSAPVLLDWEAAESRLVGYRLQYDWAEAVHFAQRRSELESTEVRVVPHCECATCLVAIPGACALAELSAETPS
jgi:hypothetical protein